MMEAVPSAITLIVSTGLEEWKRLSGFAAAWMTQLVSSGISKK